MFKFINILLLALATFNLTAALYVKCETTDGSPFKDDVERAIKLVERRTFCCQDSPSNCNDLVTDEGTAALSLCASASSPFATCILCKTLATHYTTVVNECKWADPKQNGRERVGGWIQNESPNYRLVIYHSPRQNAIHD